jgi:hypothetical protein
MTRFAFGGWGWELSDRDFGRALAALGVLARELRSEGDLVAGGDTGRGAAVAPGPSRERLADALSSMVRDSGRRLTWDLGDLEELRPRLYQLPAAWLLGAWRASKAERAQLAIAPAPGLDDRWTYELLAHATVGSTPYFRLPEPPGRLRWNWPTRVGFLPQTALFRDDLYRRLSKSVAPLTEPEVGPGRCDLLLVPADSLGGLGAVSRLDLPESTVVIMFDTATRQEPVSHCRDVAAHAGSWGVAVVHVGLGDVSEWLRTFLREMSHELPLLSCLRTAGAVTALFAAEGLLDFEPLRTAGEALTGRMERSVSAVGGERRVSALPERTTVVLGLPARARPSLPELGRRLRETDLAFASEDEGATDTAIVARATDPILRALERKQATNRFIRATVTAMGAPPKERVALNAGFQAGSVHQVAVSIGPRQADDRMIVADVPVDPERLAEAAGHRLTIVLAEPDLLAEPLVRTLELPAFGPTRWTVFRLPVATNTRTVRARISVLHRGRILQTAMLSGPVMAEDDLRRTQTAGRAPRRPGIRIRVEANLRPGMSGLDDRSRYDAAVVLNRNADGRSGGTTMGRVRAAKFEFDWVKDAIAAINRTLGEAEQDDAFERPLESEKSLVYLRALASNGVPLYDRIGTVIEETFSGVRLERLQVLSINANTILPVELIYDLAPPANDAGLCENWRDALATGKCDEAFHEVDDEELLSVVCPSGFWGISKVIERQATRKSDKGPPFQVRSIPDRDQTTLRPVTPVLFAASDRVNAVKRGEVKRVIKSLDTLTTNQIVPVERWLHWAQQVKEIDPPVLILLSHTETNVPAGASLEIAAEGGPERRALGQITKAYVTRKPKEPGPIVFLLGCTTGVPMDHFQSFVVQFEEKGASLVVGTFAPVLGRHAGQTAEALIEQIGAVRADRPQHDRGIPFGEVLRDVRRRMLAKGILMSMSLTAYGDADWRLPAKE